MSDSILIVSHCWNPPGVDLYTQHLKWQLASLVNHRTRHRFNYRVFIGCPEDDATTHAFLDEFIDRFAGKHPFGIGQASATQLSREELLRRAVGRNVAAKECKEDICWFVDADYYFGPGSLDAICDQVDETDELCWPGEIMVNKTHAIGDKMIEDARYEMLPHVNPSLFEPLKRDRAIGGLQICGGAVARERGYLDGTKWVKPIDPSKGWHQTDEDPKFRRGRKGRAIEVPNLYWIRHDYKGAWRT